jgi:hypothetical protein
MKEDTSEGMWVGMRCDVCECVCLCVYMDTCMPPDVSTTWSRTMPRSRLTSATWPWVSTQLRSAPVKWLFRPGLWNAMAPDSAANASTKPKLLEGVVNKGDRVHVGGMRGKKTSNKETTGSSIRHYLPTHSAFSSQAALTSACKHMLERLGKSDT